MADEITYAGSGANLRLAAILNKMIWEMITDKTDVRMMLMPADDMMQRGSATFKQGQVTPDEIMAAVGEGSSVANSALGTSAITGAIARQAAAYEKSDLMTLTGSEPGMLKLAAWLASAYVRRVGALVTTAASGFTAVAGASGVQMSVDNWYTGQFGLTRADVPDGEVYALLHPTQFTHWQSSLRGEGGAVQYDPGTRNLLALKRQGYKGGFNGVEIFTSARVPDDGTDYTGSMFAMGALMYAELAASRLPADILNETPFLQVAAPDSAVWVEFVRDGRGGESALVGNGYVGVAMNEQARGTRIRTGM